METKLRQNLILEFDVTDYGMNGEGVAKFGGYTVFIKGALKGEKARAKISFVKRNIAYADAIEILVPSPMRVKPPCNRFLRCGGCDMLHIEYAEQLRIKRDALKTVLRKNAGVDCEVAEVVPSSPFAYRNKLQLPFGTVEGGSRTVLGFYKEGTHKVVPIGKCFLNGEYSEKLIKAALGWAQEHDISVYEENNPRGFLRHVAARKYGEHIDVTIVGNGKTLPYARDLYDRLSAEFSSCALWFSENTKNSNVIMGDGVKFLMGYRKPAEFRGIKFYPNPLSFVQVNPEVAEKLYDKIITTVAPDENCVVVDAYAGVGTLGAVMRSAGAEIVNIEIVKEAVDDGRRLYSDNGILDKVKFIEGDAAEKLPEALKNIPNGKRVEIILDPPRKGCSERVLETLDKEAAKRPFGLIYVSCNPATLSRDLAKLTAFQPVEIVPYDMFAQTKNLETLVVLSHKKPDGHINVNVEFGEEKGRYH